MKIRMGFVSNSSSSSFVIASKGELNVGEESIKNIFKIDLNSPMFELAKRIINVLIDKSEEISDFNEWLEEEYGSFNGSEDYKEEVMAYSEVSKIKQLIDNGFSVRKGSLYNDSGDTLESFLCDDFKFEYEDETLYISNDRD